MTMGLVLADIVRRARVRVAIIGVVAAGMWWLTSEMGDPLRAFGSTIGFAVMVGPWLTLRFIPRPVFYLPVAKRDIWRAGWLFSTVGITLVTTAAKIAGLIALRATPPIEDLTPAITGLAGIALSSVYDFAATGLTCGLVILATRPASTAAPWRQLSIGLVNIADALLPAAWFAGFYGASLLHGIVPTRWGQLTARSGTVLAAALVLAIATYFHSPSPAPRANRPAAKPAAADRTRRVDAAGLSGLPRLLVHEYVWALLVGAVLGIGSVIVVLVNAHVRSPQDLAALLRLELGRLDGVMPLPGEGADPFLVLVLFAGFAATIAARYPALMRHLRVLPLGTVRLQALLVAWPAAIWLTLWLVFITLHYLFVGAMVHSLHLPAFIGLAGISALAMASSLRLSGPQNLIAFSLLLVIVPMLLFVGFPPAWVSVATGLAAFTGATALNRAALGRNVTYRHSGSPLALPLTR